jgi:hypothetical protein
VQFARLAAVGGCEEVGEVLFRVLGADLHGFRVVWEFGAGQMEDFVST